MSFGVLKPEQKIEKIKNKYMYIPQIVFMSASLILGVYIPAFLNTLIQNAVIAMSVR